MKRHSTWFLCLLCLSPRTWAQDRRGLQSWIAVWDSEAALAALRQHPDAYEELSIFGYTFDAQGHLVPADSRLPEITQQARPIAPSAKWLVSAINDVGHKQKDDAFTRHLLSDRKLRGHHIDELLNIAKSFDGLDIDYENFKKNPNPND